MGILEILKWALKAAEERITQQNRKHTPAVIFMVI